MKKSALIIGLAMIISIAVNAQQQKGSTQMKDTTSVKSKKPTQKSRESTYQMNRDTSKPGAVRSTTKRGGSMELMEDTSKIKSKGQPVYKR